jgi:hypothetical protein
LLDLAFGRGVRGIGVIIEAEVGDADSSVRYENCVPKVRFLMGSISSPKVDRLMLVSLPLFPVENKEDDAKLRPSTSLVVVARRFALRHAYCHPIK